MKTSLFAFTAIDFVVLTAVCLGLIAWAISRVSRTRVHLSPAGHWRFLGVALAWMATISGLAIAGFYTDFSTMPPKLLMGPLVPMLSIMVITLLGRFDKILKVTPPEWLMYLQTFRLPVEILLWLLFLQNLLPAQMTFEGRNWDVLVGLSAIPAGLLCFGKDRFRMAAAVVWNIAGLVLLFNIVVIAVLSMPTPFRVFMAEPANEIVATFPFVLLPGVLVPLAFALHVLSLRQLLIFRKEGITSRLQQDLSML